MPFVKVSGGTSLWADLYPAGGNATTTTTLSPNYPTLLLLSPSWLDSTFLHPLLDADLRERYHIVTLDLRTHGRSTGEPASYYDSYVGAAEVAFAMEGLGLPPAHVFGAGAVAFSIALSLCVLFPTQVESCTFVGIKGVFSKPLHLETFKELNAAWARPGDEDDFWDAADAMGMILLSKQMDKRHDVSDAVLGAFMRRYSPYKLRRLYEVSRLPHKETHMTRDTLASITQPVCLIHGTDDLAFPVPQIEEVRDALSGVKEMDYHTITDGPHLLALTHTDEVRPLYKAFLSRHAISAPSPEPIDRARALKVLAELSGNASITERDPNASASYSLQTEQDIESGRAEMEEARKLEQACKLRLPGAFEPEPWEQARPRQQWKFSTRNLTVERPVAERLSLVDGISVQVQASKREELPPTPQELSYTEPALQLPPPVPPKDSPSPHLVQGSPSFSSTARWPAVDVGSRAK